MVFRHRGGITRLELGWRCDCSNIDGMILCQLGNMG